MLKNLLMSAALIFIASAPVMAEENLPLKQSSYISILHDYIIQSDENNVINQIINGCYTVRGCTSTGLPGSKVLKRRKHTDKRSDLTPPEEKVLGHGDTVSTTGSGSLNQNYDVTVSTTGGGNLNLW